MSFKISLDLEEEKEEELIAVNAVQIKRALSGFDQIQEELGPRENKRFRMIK